MLMPELRLALRRLAPLLLALPMLGAAAQPSPLASLDDPVVAAREALRKKDKAQLATFRQQLLASGHPLAQWVDYWELSNRLPDAQQADLNAFYTRWPAPTSKTGCATTGCWNWAGAATGPTSVPSSRAFA
jgi:soluble lytic murein transglycosylase